MIRIHEGIEVFKEKLEICENESNNELTCDTQKIREMPIVGKCPIMSNDINEMSNFNDRGKRSIGIRNEIISRVSSDKKDGR